MRVSAFIEPCLPSPTDRPPSGLGRALFFGFRPLSEELHIRSAAPSLASDRIAMDGGDHVESWGCRDRNRNGDCYFGGNGHCKTKDAGQST